MAVTPSPDASTSSSGPEASRLPPLCLGARESRLRAALFVEQGDHAGRRGSVVHITGAVKIRQKPVLARSRETSGDGLVFGTK